MPDKVGIKSPPSMDIVKEHIQNLNDTLLDNWHLPKSITNTFIDLFDYLQSKKLDPIFANCNIIPIEERRLVRPSRVFFKLPDNLSPFIFQVPPSLMKFEKMLQEMGVRVIPEGKDLARLFEELGSEYDGFTLDPNELTAFLKLLDVISVANLHPSKSLIPSYILTSFL